jgi:hypothetical protein
MVTLIKAITTMVMEAEEDILQAKAECLIMTMTITTAEVIMKAIVEDVMEITQDLPEILRVTTETMILILMIPITGVKGTATMKTGSLLFPIVISLL